MGFVLFKKRTSNAEYDKWASMFPATDDCEAMQKTLMDAQNRYAKESLDFNQTRKIKIKEKAKQKMERDTLGQYITDLKSYIKDLQCGVSILPPSPEPVQSAMNDSFRLDINPEKIQNSLGANPPVNNQESANTAPDAQKKSNTLLYVGIGAVVLIGIATIVIMKKNQ
jgi:hypothetical protein